MMKKMIVEQDGVVGVFSDEEIMSLTTKEIVEANLFKVVGSVDYTKLNQSVHSNRPNQFHKMTGLVNSPRYTFYMLGQVSLMDKLQYVQMSEDVLMGFVADTAGAGYPSVYYFYRCGEVNNQPIFYYHSDMVIKEKEILWVGQNVNEQVAWTNEGTE